MSDQDLAATEGPADEFADLPPFEGEEETATEEAPEEGVETVEETAEEAEEEVVSEAEEAEETSTPASDLSEFPEEIQERIRQYGEDRVSGLQREWQPKLEEAATLRKSVEQHEAIWEFARTDPQGFLKELGVGGGQEEAPAGPAEPGEAPDPVENPQGYSQWARDKESYRDHLLTAKLEAMEKKIAEGNRPAQELAARAQVAQKLQGIQQDLGSDNVQFGKMAEIMQRAQKEPWRIAQELVVATEALAALKTSKAAHAKEVVAGIEEKPGLPRSGARVERPVPTGDLVQDVLAELNAEGVPFED